MHNTTQEIERCKNDFSYFVENYVVIMNKNTNMKIKLTKIQKELLNYIRNEHNERSGTIV